MRDSRADPPDRESRERRFFARAVEEAAARGAASPAERRAFRAAASELVIEELLARRVIALGGRIPEGGPIPRPRLDRKAEQIRETLRPLLQSGHFPRGGLPVPELGILREELMARGQRKAHGSWSTPSALAHPTAERVLAPLLARRDAPDLAVCDPAAGAGAFLMAALDVLSSRSGADRFEIARRSLFGMDSDPVAAALAAWSIWESCSRRDAPIEDLFANIRAGDGLSDLERGRFDAVIGNPPWETLQPSEREFLADRAEGLASGDCRDASVRGALLEGDEALREEWRLARARSREAAARLRQVYSLQGPGKLFAYRLFLEQAYRLLRDGGRLGLILPASFCFDRGALPLRRLLLDAFRLEWAFWFENREGIFPIDSRYRFGPVIAAKGGRTESFRTASGRIDPADWSSPAPPHVIWTRSMIRRLSPRHLCMLDLRHERDAGILSKIHENGRPFLGGGAGEMAFAQGDFNLTSHRSSFMTLAAIERMGAAPCRDGSWTAPGGRRYLPLYQGAMIHVLQPHAADHARGTGHGTVWKPPADPSILRPQFLVPQDAVPELPAIRIGFRTLSNATNERTVISCLMGPLPCGNSIGLLTPRGSISPALECAFGAGVMGSLAFDWAMRQRLTGTNLNRFVLEECVWPSDPDAVRPIARLALRLCTAVPWHEPMLALARQEGWGADIEPATGEAERSLLLVELDVAVARAYKVTTDDLAWMLRGCDSPPGGIRARSGDADPRGFWRIDRARPPHERHPNRVLARARQSEDSRTTEGARA
ncbi:MAG: hypothetical protein Fur0037_25290 [Planctomycetota bacterium]